MFYRKAHAMNKKVIRMFFLIGFIISFIVIFYLTTQTPNDTIALTNKAIEILPRFLIEPTDSTGKVLISARRMAHMYEFLLLGTFISAYIITFDFKGKNLVSLLVCASCSIFDQTHKLFVPGREFDYRDLVLDFFGYFLSIIIVNIVYVIVCFIIKKSSNLEN